MNVSSPGFTIGDYRSYRGWHYRSYRRGAIGLSDTIGVLSEFTIGLSDRGSSGHTYFGISIVRCHPEALYCFALYCIAWTYHCTDASPCHMSLVHRPRDPATCHVPRPAWTCWTLYALLPPNQSSLTVLCESVAMRHGCSSCTGTRAWAWEALVSSPMTTLYNHC